MKTYFASEQALHNVEREKRGFNWKWQVTVTKICCCCYYWCCCWCCCCHIYFDRHTYVAWQVWGFQCRPGAGNFWNSWLQLHSSLGEEIITIKSRGQKVRNIHYTGGRWKIWELWQGNTDLEWNDWGTPEPKGWLHIYVIEQGQQMRLENMEMMQLKTNKQNFLCRLT